MTCICGHHEAVHRAMCGAPEGCHCHCFVAATPLPAKRLAEMTDSELDQWIRQRQGEGMSWARAQAALRDAIRAEAMEETSRIVSEAVDGCDAATIRAERAERERDAARSLCEELRQRVHELVDSLATAESALGESRREASDTLAQEIVDELARLSQVPMRSLSEAEMAVLMFANKAIGAVGKIAEARARAYLALCTRATPQPETPE